MRTYIPKAWRDDKHRYLELKYWCLQYPKWQVEAANILGASGASLSTMPHGTEPGDPTERAVEHREELMRKIAIVDRCAKAVDGGRWFSALILHICNGRTYERIRDFNPELLRSSDRNAFYAAKAKFFDLLDKERD